MRAGGIKPYYLKKSSANAAGELMRGSLSLIGTTYLVIILPSEILVWFLFLLSLAYSVFYLKKILKTPHILIFTTKGVYDINNKCLVRWSRVEYFYFIQRGESSIVVFKMRRRTESFLELDITEGDASTDEMLVIISRYSAGNEIFYNENPDQGPHLIDFTNIGYLMDGTERQQNTYSLLREFRIFEILSNYDPIVVGTIPINLDIESSDLDICCCFSDKEIFMNRLVSEFGGYQHFSITEVEKQSIPSVVASFKLGKEKIEIFGQNIPSREQYAYRHMIVEYKILQQQGEDFRKKVLNLKRKGIKTEPAFAQLLGLKGDPYEALLKYEQ